MSFYVTLPSNSSTNIFDNTISNFTTQLHLPITLNGPYEVALVEFSYDHYWKVDIGQLKYYHSDNVVFELDVEHQDGDTIESLMSKINEELNMAVIQHETQKLTELNINVDQSEMRTRVVKKLKKKNSINNLSDTFPFLTFNSRLHQLEIKTISDSDQLRFEGPITHLLGLDFMLNSLNTPIKIDRKYENGIYIINNLYVYSDIIKYQYIGDTLSPLLRTINIQSNKVLSTESVIYDSPHYIPVNKSSIDTINIKIKDELGNNIKFERGKSIVKLHFRPIFYGF